MQEVVRSSKPGNKFKLKVTKKLQVPQI